MVYNDPHVPVLQEDDLDLTSVDLTIDELEKADCIVALTNHSEYDWQQVVDNSMLVVDTRNATRDTQPGKASIVSI